MSYWTMAHWTGPLKHVALECAALDWNPGAWGMLH